MQEDSNPMTLEEAKALRAESAGYFLGYLALLGALREQYALIQDKLVFADKMNAKAAHEALNRIFRHFDANEATDGELYNSMVGAHMELLDAQFKQIKELLLNEEVQGS
jgi:hypothetical protein